MRRLSSQAPPAGPLFEQTDVWVSGADGYHTYRIPAIARTPAGTLLAFCEGRKTSPRDHGDIDLLVKRSSDGGRTWSAQQIVYEEGGTAEITIGNPCPVVEQATGAVWLPFCRDNRRVLITRSTDDGIRWSWPVEITPYVKRPEWGWVATGPGVGIQLASGPHRGRLLIPCDHQTLSEGRPVKRSHVFYSDDHGRSWRLGGWVADHTDECQVVETAGGDLLINMRNYWERDGGRPERGGMRAIAYSRDGGDSWTGLSFDETLIEPVCQASFLRYTLAPAHDRNRLLFSNPASRDKRVRLTVRLSYDEGASWPVSRTIHEGPAAYSCLVVLADQTIGCLYERGDQHPYEKICFARFNLEWLSGGADRLA